MIYKRTYEMNMAVLNGSGYNPFQHQILGITQVKEKPVFRIKKQEGTVFPSLTDAEHKVNTSGINLIGSKRFKEMPQLSQLSTHLPPSRHFSKPQSLSSGMQTATAKSKTSKTPHRLGEIHEPIRSPFLAPVVNGLNVYSQFRKFVKKNPRLKRRNSEKSRKIIQVNSMLAVTSQRIQYSGLEQVPTPQELQKCDEVQEAYFPQEQDDESFVRTHSQLAEVHAHFFGASDQQLATSSSKQLQKRQKRFIMQIAYPDMKAALIKRGWAEETDKNSLKFDLKFTLNSQDIVFAALKKDQMINHNRGEGNMTCKSLLVDSLNESPLYWFSWLCSEGDRPSRALQKVTIPGIQHGVDSYYPKSFVLTSGKDFLEFQLYYWQIFCESFLKNFIKNYNPTISYKKRGKERKIKQIGVEISHWKPEIIFNPIYF